MKKLFLICFACLAFQATKAQVIVKIKPNRPAHVVAKPAKAKQGHIWVDGHWKWNPKTKQYVWVKGNWVKSRPESVWVPGHWKAVPGGHKWIEGHWKKR